MAADPSTLVEEPKRLSLGPTDPPEAKCKENGREDSFSDEEDGGVPLKSHGSFNLPRDFSFVDSFDLHSALDDEPHEQSKRDKTNCEVCDVRFNKIWRPMFHCTSCGACVCQKCHIKYYVLSDGNARWHRDCKKCLFERDIAPRKPKANDAETKSKKEREHIHKKNDLKMIRHNWKHDDEFRLKYEEFCQEKGVDIADPKDQSQDFISAVCAEIIRNPWGQSDEYADKKHEKKDKKEKKEKKVKKEKKEGKPDKDVDATHESVEVDEIASPERPDHKAPGFSDGGASTMSPGRENIQHIGGG